MSNKCQAITDIGSKLEYKNELNIEIAAAPIPKL